MTAQERLHGRLLVGESCKYNHVAAALSVKVCSPLIGILTVRNITCKVFRQGNRTFWASK